MKNTTHPLTERIAGLEERLRRYANRHANDFVESSELYQIAVEEILTNCSPTDNDTYMLRLADWRMRNAVKRERVYSIRIDAFDLEAEEDEEGLQISDITNEPEAETVQREMSRKIQEILRGMKPEYVTIIELLNEGKNPYDIASVVGTTRQNIEYHIRKIRKVFETAGMTPAFAMAR